MSNEVWITLVSLGANLTLVIIAYFALRAVKRQQEKSDIAARRQQKQSEKNLLTEIRYGLEGDVTQLRATEALILRKPEGWKKLEEREKQYDKTIKELAGKIAKLEEELQNN